MINAVTLCILVPWIDGTDSWRMAQPKQTAMKWIICTVRLLLTYICIIHCRACRKAHESNASSKYSKMVIGSRLRK